MNAFIDTTVSLSARTNRKVGVQVVKCKVLLMEIKGIKNIFEQRFN